MNLNCRKNIRTEEMFWGGSGIILLLYYFPHMCQWRSRSCILLTFYLKINLLTQLCHRKMKTGLIFLIYTYIHTKCIHVNVGLTFIYFYLLNYDLFSFFACFDFFFSLSLSLMLPSPTFTLIFFLPEMARRTQNTHTHTRIFAWGISHWTQQ